MKLGIDFGTCYSSAALLLDNVPTPINAPLTPGYSFPSSIFITEQGEILVGQAAENNRQKNPHCYRREFKRDLGSTDPYTLGNVFILPEESIAEVLKKLKIEAEKVAGGRGVKSLTDVRITVPATYNAYKRELMKTAGKNAGFSQVEILEEPVAAAMYYARSSQLEDGAIVLVYDLGGGTFDATLMQKQGDKYQILAMPKGLANCGGIDFDRSIYQYLKNNCSVELQQQLEPKDAWLARSIVGDLCRDLKHQLSEQSEASAYIPIGLGQVETFELSRSQFNQMISPLIMETLDCCDSLLRSAGKEYSQIDRMLLVGGSSRIPFVKEAIEQKFKISPFLVDKPELAVCLGAAIDSIHDRISVPQPESILASSETIQRQIDLGDTLYQQGNLRGAIAQYKAALKLDANHNIALSKIAMVERSLQADIMAELERKNQAVAISQSKLADEPIDRQQTATPKISTPENISVAERIQAAINSGDILYQQGKLAEAIAKYQAALQLDPNHNIARQKIQMVERSLKQEPTTEPKVKTPDPTPTPVKPGMEIPKFPKQWVLPWEGRYIVVKNWWNLIGNSCSELWIDGNMVDRKEGAVFSRELMGEIEINGKIQYVRAHIGSINFGMSLGCQIFINNQMVGGDINKKFYT